MKNIAFFIVLSILLTSCGYSGYGNKQDKEIKQVNQNTVLSVVPSEIPSVKASEYANQKEASYLVYIYSDLCDHCREFQPVISKYIERENSLNMYAVDVDDKSNHPILKQLGINGTPTLILIKNTFEVWRKEGVLTIDQIPKSDD